MSLIPEAILNVRDCFNFASFRIHVFHLHTQRVHVGIWYILRAQRGSHIPTLGPKYVLSSYMDPLG